MKIGVVLPPHLEPEQICRTLDSLEKIASKSTNQFHVISQVGFATESFPSLVVAEISESDYSSLRFLDQFGPDDFLEFLPTAVTFSETAFAQYEKNADSLPSVQMHFDAGYKHPLMEHVVEQRSLTVNGDETIWSGVFPLIVSASVLLENRELDLLDHSILYSFCLVTFGRIRLVPNSIVMSDENPDVLYLDEFDEDWYLKFASGWQHFFGFCAERYQGVPVSVQKTFLYLLEERVATNVNTKHKQVLNDRQIDAFWTSVGESLNSVSTELILRGDDVLQKLNRSSRIYLQNLRVPVNQTLTYQRVGNDVLTRSGYTTIGSLSGTRVAIDSMSYHDGLLEIAGFFPAFVDHENVRLYLELSSGERVALQDVQRYSEFKIFGRTIHRHPTFVASLSTDQIVSSTWIRFVSEDLVSGGVLVHDLKFRKPMAKLTARNRSYWNLGPVFARYEGRRICFEPATTKNLLVAELRFMFSLVRNREKFAFRSVALRTAYWVTKPLLSKRRIWIYSDKFYKAGDNGEYAFTYASKQNDGIKKYYVQRADTPDASRFKQQGKKFIKFGTVKHKLLFLHSDIVYATHTVLPFQHGFRSIERHFRGLFRYNTVFLQHGLSVQRLPWILNKYVDNTRMYCLASGFEEKNLLLPEAGYSPDDLVHTGVARYDGLVSKTKKKILLTPTWRTYLAPPGKPGELRPKSEQFLRSDYFLLYTQLLQNERLLKTAAVQGYTIQFLLHPAISAHSDDFREALPAIEVLAATDDVSYEKLLTEANIMVTDYSGVQFDFAYMDKPVVYYHPESLPPSYEEGVYSYEENALGKVFSDQKLLVEELCTLMENGNLVEDEFQRRITDFFYQQDTNNAQRIYETVIAKNFQRQ